MMPISFLLILLVWNSNHYGSIMHWVNMCRITISRTRQTFQIRLLQPSARCSAYVFCGDEADLSCGLAYVIG